jgi:hypothetical protein
MWLLLLIPWLIAAHGHAPGADDRLVHRVVRSAVTFTSTAPMETITATNHQVSGVLGLPERTFAVRVPIVEFQGFNAPLQREHFNENYMASRLWPHALFTGRIIESPDLTVPAAHDLRAKGTLTIHGVEQERIVPCHVVVGEAGIRVTADLEVALADHAIRIPRVVEQKIAAVVQVRVDLFFGPEDGAR